MREDVREKVLQVVLSSRNDRVMKYIAGPISLCRQLENLSLPLGQTEERLGILDITLLHLYVDCRLLLTCFSLHIHFIGA
jgi:hypothetical protein